MEPLCALNPLDLELLQRASHLSDEPGGTKNRTERNAWLRLRESLMTARADFASQDYFRDPGAAIEKLRTLGPVVEVRFPIIGKLWTTTAQALADQVLKDTATFTMRKENGDVAGLQWG